MTPEQWKQRFIAHIVGQLTEGFTPEGALEVAQAEYDAITDMELWRSRPGAPQTVTSYMDEEPEASADECLSYWDDDGDTE